MGREVRRVPADWRHPKDGNGRYIPLRKGDYAALAAQWDEGQRKWDLGWIITHSVLAGGPAWRPRDEHTRARTYEEHAGPRPLADAYMPASPAAQRTHWQMYETTTAGTPLSPPCVSAADLAKWLADHHADAGVGMTATEAEWLAMMESGKPHAPFALEGGRARPAFAIGKKR